jgi:hypothetical protein
LFQDSTLAVTAKWHPCAGYVADLSNGLLTTPGSLDPQLVAAVSACNEITKCTATSDSDDAPLLTVAPVICSTSPIACAIESGVGICQTLTSSISQLCTDAACAAQTVTNEVTVLLRFDFSFTSHLTCLIFFYFFYRNRRFVDASKDVQEVHANRTVNHPIATPLVS